MNTFKKYENNPLFPYDLGTCFDAYVWVDNGRYRMDFSWRPQKSVAVSFSDDGINWTHPEITLPPNLDSGWEDDINRNCVIKDGDVYKMWYTGQANGKSAMGYAESDDGIHFERKTPKPIIFPEHSWENLSVMNPCVLKEDGKYRMWYAAGETYEPNVIAYAESSDGIKWVKREEPIYKCDETKEYEKDRVGGCQVIKTEEGYLMFYIGYSDIHSAKICLARSEDGITNWERSKLNPIVAPTEDGWDAHSCYKPTVVFDEKTDEWKLWYNGRKWDDENIGLVLKKGKKLF